MEQLKKLESLPEKSRRTDFVKLREVLIGKQERLRAEQHQKEQRERLEAEQREKERLEAEQRERERPDAERRQHEEKLEDVPQSQLSSPVAPSTLHAQPEADKPSAETPKVVHPLPPKPSEPEHVKSPPPSYRLYVVHRGSTGLVEELINHLLSKLQNLHFDPAKLEILVNQMVDPGDYIALGLYFGSNAASTDPECREQIKSLKKASIPVVPLVVAGADFQEFVPNSLHPINALDRSSLVKASTAVLHLLGLTEKHRRVFVSYQRSDSLLIGEQVWETLGEAGSSAFLDSFSFDPDVEYRERLSEVLGDKAFLLVVESPSATTSKWAEYEVEYARKSRMGLLALTPDEITHAIVATCRAVFAAGGQLVVESNPSVTPLVIMIAEEYLRVRLRDESPSVIVYQSKFSPSATLDPPRVKWPHFVKVHHSDEALHSMRTTMLRHTSPVAGILIGGTEDIYDQAALFRELCFGRTLYFVGAPGGATQEFAENEPLEFTATSGLSTRELRLNRYYPALLQRIVLDIAKRFDDRYDWT